MGPSLTFLTDPVLAEPQHEQSVEPSDRIRCSSTDIRSLATALAAAVAGGLTVVWALESPCPADRHSGAPYGKLRTGAAIRIGEQVRDMQRIFRPISKADGVKADGSDFDKLFTDDGRSRVRSANRAPNTSNGVTAIGKIGLVKAPRP